MIVLFGSQTSFESTVMLLSNSEDERRRKELEIVRMKLALIEEFDELEKSLVLDQNSIENFLDEIFCDNDATICQNANNVRMAIREANKVLLRSSTNLRRSVTPEQLRTIKQLQEEELSEKLRKSIPELKNVVGRLENRLESVQWDQLSVDVNWQGVRQWSSALWLRLNGKANPGESIELRLGIALNDMVPPLSNI